WPGEDTFKNFRIHLVGDDNGELHSALTALSKGRTLKGRAIIVSRGNTPSVPSSAHLLYVNSGTSEILPRLFQQIEGKNILLVSDNYPDKRLIMLNLYDTPDQRVLFELHRANMINQGFKVTEDLVLLGGTEVDVAQLYRQGQQIQRELQQYGDSLEQSIAVLENTLQNNLALSKLQRDSIGHQQEKIRQQQTEIKKQQASITRQQTQVQNQLLELFSREKILQQLKDKIAVQETILNKGAQEIVAQQEQMKNQSAEIASHLTELELREEQITRQRYITALTILVTLLVLTLLILIYRGYRRSGQLNKLLEQRVQERTKDLNKLNRQLREQLAEQEQLEKELIATNTHLSDVLGSMTDAFITLDFDYHITYMNAEAERINKKPATACIGKTHWEEWPASVGTQVEEQYRKAMQERIAVHFEHHYILAGVYDVWLNVHAYPTAEGLAIYYHDITQRKAAEERLKKSQAALAEAQSIGQLGSWELKLDTGETSWSDVMFDLTGFDPENGVPPLDVFLSNVDSETRQKLEKLHQLAIANNTPFTLAFKWMRYKESPKWFEARVRPVCNSKGAVEGLAGVLLDISDRKLVEEKLEERVASRTAELAREKERAEAADRVKSAFLATMSHELRTPLNSIIGFTGILLRQHTVPLNQEQENKLGMVQRSARHLLDLINDVLDISKIEAGELELHFSKVNLIPVLQEIMEIVEPLARQKEIDLLFEPGNLNGEILTDAKRIRQIILNIVNNAVKFTESGNVVMRCNTIDQQLVIAVTDSGIGIPEHQLNTIFKPFSQVDNGLTRAHEGTGLGLSISMKLTQMLGGTIKVTSTYGKGSTFTVLLPIQPLFSNEESTHN
ncbi:MAG: DUF4154 domain-containing protein, partial [Flavobacteriales bacterium]|nr:DUF4154 domain-containing protein [Flavobacteriales bacterium]